METTALAVTNQVTPSIWQTVENMAPVMFKSKLFGVQNSEQAMMIMIRGYELGFPLTTSLEFIHVIDSKPSLSPKGALALIMNSPKFSKMDVKEESDSSGVPKSCSVTMQRNNGFSYTSKFSMDDAKRAGLIRSGSGWEKYPSSMLKWRAIGYCADVVFPDITGGMKRADEYGADITIDGQVIVVDNSQPTIKKKDTGAMLQELLNQYSPIEILEANNNVLPSTIEEIETIREKLEVSNGK